MSVVIPCYNAATFLADALASTRAQSLQPDEVIVVDDNSSDNSGELARQWGARVLRTSVNSGSAAARNVGLKTAKNEIVALLDADDVWETDHLSTVVPLLESYPEVVLAFSRARTFGERVEEWPAILPEGIPVHARAEALKRCILPQNAVVMRRSMVLSIGGYDNRYRLAQDFDLWLRLSHHFPFVCTHKITVNWRRHSRQNSRDLKRYWEGEYLARYRFLHSLQAIGDESTGEVELALRSVWEGHLATAWHNRRNADMLFHLSMSHLVPGAELVKPQWNRKRLLLPLAILTDKLRWNEKTIRSSS